MEGQLLILTVLSFYFYFPSSSDGPLLVVASGRDTISVASSVKRLAPENVFVVQVKHDPYLLISSLLNYLGRLSSLYMLLLSKGDAVVLFIEICCNDLALH